MKAEITESSEYNSELGITKNFYKVIKIGKFKQAKKIKEQNEEIKKLKKIIKTEKYNVDHNSNYYGKLKYRTTYLINCNDLIFRNFLIKNKIEIEVDSYYRGGFRHVSSRQGIFYSVRKIKNLLAKYENLNKEKEAKEELKIKKAKEESKNIDKVLLALYSINKIAKEYRDKQNNIAHNLYKGGGNYISSTDRYHDALHENKERKEYLYNLKNQVLEKIVKELNITPSGYHTFSECLKMKYYEIKGYSFHCDYNEEEGLTYLGNISNLIPSNKKRSMSESRAIAILNNY